MKFLDHAWTSLRRLGSQHTTRPRLFVACVVGATVGSSPFFGAHLPICLGLAALFGLNRLVVYGAAQVSIPPLAPLVALACIESGSRVLYGHGSAMALGALTNVRPWRLAGEVLACWLVGTPVVGLLLGSVLGLLVLATTVWRAAATVDPFASAVGELLGRFARAPRAIREYVRWKLRLDPVYRTICQGLPDGITIVDLGAGLGIFPILLSLLGVRRSVHAVDYDAAKIAHASRAGAGLPCTFEVADVRAWTLPPCDVILLIDVLHYLPPDEQLALMTKARDTLRRSHRGCSSDGREVERSFLPQLLVRDGDRQARRGAWTRALETLALRVGWNRGATTWFRSSVELADALRGLGFCCEHVLVSGPLHPGNFLIRAVLPADAERSPVHVEAPPSAAVSGMEREAS